MSSLTAMSPNSALTCDVMQPVWLVSQGRVLASAQLASSRRERRRGLIGHTEIVEPLVLDSCNWIHTLGMRVAIDIAYLSAEGQVVSVSTMRPWRVGTPVRGACRVVEASAGSFERWNLQPGDTVEVRGDTPDASHESKPR